VIQINYQLLHDLTDRVNTLLDRDTFEFLSLSRTADSLFAGACDINLNLK